MIEQSATCDVSVLIITYNHQAYVAQALDSVLAQRTSRNFEIVVSEDRSTDATFEIVERYARLHDRIRIIRSERNIRSNEVVARAIRAARGRYVCMLDGDDYWLGVDRLEDQAARLDRSPEISAVFGNAAVFEDGGAPSDRRWTPPEHPALTDLEDLWEGNPFASCAGMMRRSALADLDPWYSEFFLTDWPQYIVCARSGPIAFENKITCAYRQHAGGQFSALTTRARLDQIEDFYRRMERVRAAGPRRFIRAGRTRYFFGLAQQYARQGEAPLARDCLARALRAGGLGRSVRTRDALGMARRLWSGRRAS
jgi:glycosyltransferase involved in cell wall biosynthesis